MNPSQWYEKAYKYIMINQYDKALPLVEKGIEKKDHYCQFLLSYIYGYHLFANYNPNFSNEIKETIFPKLLEFARTGHSEAMSIIGGYYYMGFPPVMRDIQKANEWYLKGAELGNPSCQNYLANNYLYGRFVKRDLNKAFYWYKLAAESGLAKAQNNLANRYLYGEGTLVNYNKAFKWFQKSASQGLGYAQTNLGICYQLGIGVKQNLPLAIRWFRKASKNNYARAQDYLGDAYKYGRGVKIDYKKALYWYESAISLGNYPTYLEAGDSYLRGCGTKSNPEKAKLYFDTVFDILNQKVDNNDVLACLHLAKIYELGLGRSASLDNLRKMLLKAAHMGSAEAQFRLGYLYEVGHGVEIDYFTAKKWYEEAANQGHILALTELGKLYYRGLLNQHYYEEAVRCWRRAANNHAEAAFHLGYAYYFGDGVNRDLGMAQKFFERAIEQGYEEANYVLEITKRDLKKMNSSAEEYNFNFEYFNQKFPHTQPKKRMDRVIEELKKDFGDSWDVLTEAAQTKIASSLLTLYDKALYLDVMPADFSGIVVELTTALEIELKKYFYSGYIDFIKEKNISASAMKGTEIFVVFDEETSQWKYQFEKLKFTLGDIKYIMGINKTAIKKLDDLDSLSLKEGYYLKKSGGRGEQVYITFGKQFVDYAETLFHEKVFSKSKRRLEILDYLNWLVNDVYAITRDYRNKAAHDTVMSLTDAEVCFEWLVKQRKILPRFLSALHHS